MNIEKNKTPVFTVVFLFFAFSMYFILHYIKYSSTDEYVVTKHDTVTIKQDIGGVLLCYPTFNSNTRDFEVDYYYEVNNRSLYIGKGKYSGRWWDNKVQLKRYKNWVLLKTGAYYAADKVIVGNISKDEWSEYVLTPNSIEADNRSRLKRSVIGYESFIDSIKDGQVFLHYMFKSDPSYISANVFRNVIYKIDEHTGEPILTSIENIE